MTEGRTHCRRSKRLSGPAAARCRFTLNLGRDPVTGNRRQRVYTYDTEKEAEQERARLTGQLVEGRYTDRTAETVTEMLDAYLESACYGLAENTRVSYAGALLPVRERLGRRKLQSMTRTDVEDLRDWMLAQGRRRGGTPGTPLGPRSVRLTLGRLRAALEMACQEGWLARNPAEHVRLPAQHRRAGTTWSEAELRRFAAAAAGPAGRVLAAVAARDAARRGMRAALGRRGPGRPHGDDRPRPGPGRRQGDREARPSPNAGTGRCRWTRPRSPRCRRCTAARSASGRRRPGLRHAGYVAADELGAPLHPERYSDEFARLCRAAGVPVIRLHDTRHTANSLMAAAGVPDHIRAAWCGHTVAVNVATYTHARPEDMAVAGEALSGILGGV